MQTKRNHGLVTLLALLLTTAQAHAFDLKTQVETYKLRYGLRDLASKLIDNDGNGYDALYGARNVRVVLHGVYYRGGANNKMNRYEPRSNMNPLPTHGLTNLCEEGFTEAVYLYPDNFESAPTSSSCKTTKERTSNKLAYNQLNGFTRGNERELVEKIYRHIKGDIPGPLYAHCWNGWHASGFVATMALKQFCGYSDDKAEDYWVKNTDGNLEGMEAARKRVREFQPFTDISITKAERDLICP